MKQQFRLLAAIAAAFIAILATKVIHAQDKIREVVDRDSGALYIILADHVDADVIIRRYDGVYRKALENAGELEPGEHLTAEKLYRVPGNSEKLIPVCVDSFGRATRIGGRGDESVWRGCERPKWVPIPLQRIRIPTQQMVSYEMAKAFYQNVRSCLKADGCTVAKVAELMGTSAPQIAPPTAGTPPVVQKPVVKPQTPAELKADNERLTGANEILAGSITELTKNLESLKGANERLEQRIKDLQGRPSLDTVYTVAGVGGSGLLIVGLLIGLGLMGMRRPKVAPVAPKDPPRPLPLVGMFTERQLNERVRVEVEAVVLKKTVEANTVNQQLAATSAAAILAETKKREAAEARVKELEPSKKALDKILDAIGLADAAYSTLAFADSIPNAFGRSLIPQDRPVEDPGAREKLRDKFAAALKGVYDALGLALHRDGDFVASLFSPPKPTVLPAASQTPPTSAVPSSGSGFEGTGMATLPGGLKALPPPKIDAVDHGTEDSGVYTPFSDPVGEAALAAHTGSSAQTVAEPKTITLPYGINVDASPPMDEMSQASVPGNGARVHPEHSDDLEPGRISKTPTLRPKGLPSEPPSS